MENCRWRIIRPAGTATFWNLEETQSETPEEKSELVEIISSKNVYLDYTTAINSLHNPNVISHIEGDFPWSSAFCASTLNPQQVVIY